MASTPAEAAAQRVKGTIQRVTFHNAENGFTVLQVGVGPTEESIPVVGYLFAPRVGEHVEAAGRWETDRRHGPQFRADHLRSVPPASEEAVLKYLSSGQIRGVGPHMAEMLVQTFGRDLFDVLDKEPRRLLKVRGLGKKRLAMITESWSQQRSVRDLMVFLQDHGIGGERAVRIYKQYGADAITHIKQDPYRLAADIRGIGFGLADELASRLGIDRQSPLRARAGLTHVLSELTADGHCAYPEEQLVSRTGELLQIDQSIIRGALRDEIAREALVAEQLEQERWVYLAALHRAEVGLAGNLRRLLAGPHPLPDIKTQAAVEWVQKKVRLTLADRQRQAVMEALRNKVLIITGGPGVGKTTILNCILRIAAAKDLECVLCAPTGRAAKRMSAATGLEARTVHRLLEFEPHGGQFQRDEHRPLKGDLFVVDEVSMMDVPLCHALLRAIPGDAAVLLVGDVDQLPSVGPGTVLADLIRSGAIHTVRLKEVFRQAAESAIIRAAHEVNRGRVPDLKPPGGLRDFYFVRADEPEAVVGRIIRLVRERIPERFGLDPRTDIQVITPMNRGPLGTEHLNRVLQEVLNPAGPAKGELTRPSGTFRLGDRVMQTENDYDKEVFNGDMGTIVRVDAEQRELTVSFDGRPVAYGSADLEQLVLAYAVTIHKSQGSEYPAVVVVAHTQHYHMLQRNLLYTAITRGKRLVVLVGTSRALSIAVRRAHAGRRYSALAGRLGVAPRTHAADR